MNGESMTAATASVQPRIKNPAEVIPEASKAIQALVASAMQGDAPAATLGLVHLRASQINGCSFCVDSGSKHAKQAGETDERLFAVAAWRETPYFTDAERAALALTEAVTRLSDRADPVPDDIWEEAARHYDERALAAIILWIATTNVFNRLNVTVRQPAGAADW
jgi:AhpD family alkylhydroperoxidase